MGGLNYGRNNICLFILLDFVKVVSCDTYSIAGLVASSTCAGVLFVVVLAVAALTFAWKDAAYEYLTSHGKVKVPRSWIERENRKVSPRNRAKAQNAIEIRLIEQQRRRQNLHQAWRENFQSQGSPVSMDPGNRGQQGSRIDVHDNKSYTGIETSPIVTEVESDRGSTSRYVPYTTTRSSRFSNYSNSNMAHFGNAAIQNNKMSVSTQSVDLSDDDVLTSASRSRTATMETHKRDDVLDNITDNTAKFQRRQYQNGPTHSRYLSVDSDPGLI